MNDARHRFRQRPPLPVTPSGRERGTRELPTSGQGNSLNRNHGQDSVRRRSWLKTALGAVLCGSPAILGGAGRTPGDKPNLLFLWTDEQRADTLAVYGTLSQRPGRQHPGGLHQRPRRDDGKPLVDRQAGSLWSLLQNSLGSGIYCQEELLSLGARASRPHKTWQGRGDWLHRVGRFTRRLTLEQRLDKYAGGTPALPGQSLPP